jgi:hypothetical protein
MRVEGWEMNRFLGSTALVGFALSLVAHIATVVGVDVSSQVPYIWTLHAGAILAFGSLALSARKVLRRDRAFGKLLDHLPAWAVIVLLAVLGYAIVNSILCLQMTGDGNAAVAGGQDVLTMHGRVLSHLTEQEYHAHRAHELRLFSGYWLIFFLVSGTYFFLSRVKRRHCAYGFDQR